MALIIVQLIKQSNHAEKYIEVPEAIKCIRVIILYVEKMDSTF